MLIELSWAELLLLKEGKHFYGIVYSADEMGVVFCWLTANEIQFVCNFT